MSSLRRALWHIRRLWSDHLHAPSGICGTHVVAMVMCRARCSRNQLAIECTWIRSVVYMAACMNRLAFVYTHSCRSVVSRLVSGFRYLIQ